MPWGSRALHAQRTLLSQGVLTAVFLQQRRAQSHRHSHLGKILAEEQLKLPEYTTNI